MSENKVTNMDEVVAHVKALLEEAGLEYAETSEDGPSLWVGFAGETDDERIGVDIGFLERETVLGVLPFVHLAAPMVDRVELTEENVLKALVWANRINTSSILLRARLLHDRDEDPFKLEIPFGSEGMVIMEAELLAIDLDGTELLVAIGEVGETADFWDDRVAHLLGGVTYAKQLTKLAGLVAPPSDN